MAFDATVAPGGSGRLISNATILRRPLRVSLGGYCNEEGRCTFECVRSTPTTRVLSAPRTNPAAARGPIGAPSGFGVADQILNLP
jgi:hypothetical protein